VVGVAQAVQGHRLPDGTAEFLEETQGLLAGREGLVVLAEVCVAPADHVKPGDWRALAASVDIVGQADSATAVLAAIDHDCDVLTARPRLYAGLDGDMILPIEE
jgi:hypothetical protein